MKTHGLKFLITGSAGFVGFHLSKLLLSKNFVVLGLDGFTDYYDVKLKKSRNKLLKNYKNFTHYKCMLEDEERLYNICKKEKPNVIIHLAAQAGVRYSLENPRSYVNSNLIGTFNILEIAKELKPKHLLIASTSSVYGDSANTPFNEKECSDFPLSFYAATKKSIEVMAHSYSYSYKIPTTIFRFFTVYGPWGRPDMALFKFTKAILSNKPIDVYNNGDMKRDFTYIEDLVSSIFLLINAVPKFPSSRYNKIKNDSLSMNTCYRIVNIGNAKTINLLDFLNVLENLIGKKAIKNFKEMQIGDVKVTHSDTSLLNEITNFSPNTDIRTGIKKFIDWFLEYYSNK